MDVSFDMDLLTLLIGAGRRLRLRIGGEVGRHLSFDDSWVWIILLGYIAVIDCSVCENLPFLTLLLLILFLLHSIG